MHRSMKKEFGSVYSCPTIRSAGFDPGGISASRYYATPEPTSMLLAMVGLLLWPRRARRGI